MLARNELCIISRVLAHQIYAVIINWYEIIQVWLHPRVQPTINQHTSLPNTHTWLMTLSPTNKNMQKPEEVSQLVFTDKVSWVKCLVQ